MADEHGFSEADLASVVQQAMDGLADGELPQDEHANTDQNNEVDEFEQEIQRQIEAQFQQQQEEEEQQQRPSSTEREQGIDQDGGDNDDDFAKEVERQLQEQMNEQMAQHTEAEAERLHNDTAQTDYEQELQKQIMDALDDDPGSVQPATDSHDFEQDLQKQIMDAFSATEVSSNVPVQQKNDSLLEPKSQLSQTASHHQSPSPQPQGQGQSEYELQLQKQIMDAFSESNDAEQGQSVSDSQQLQSNFDRDLQNQILLAFNETQGQQSEQQQLQHTDTTIDADEDPFKVALAELVRNVVDGEADSEVKQQLLQSNADDEEIDMNQIMQNALALAVEDPTALLQSMNIGGDQAIDNAYLGQMIQQTQEQAKGKKAIKAKEKKPPKEKKPRQPRKTTIKKKKKDQPIVSQVPTFIPNPQFSITGIPFPQNLQHLPQSLQAQFQQQIQQQQQMLLLQQQHLQSQQQLALPAEGALPVKQQQQVAPAKKAIPQRDLSKPEPKLPKPAPANSITDSVKRVPPLMLLSRDTSIDLANSSKQKKSSLSIAETLALSRQAMSSGKFSSKLQETKPPEQHQQRVPAVSEPPAPLQPYFEPQQETTQDAYNFDNEVEKASIESTLGQMYSQDEPIHRGSKISDAPSPQLPLASGSNGNALLNNIGVLLPNLPSHLTSLISSAISQALANTTPQQQPSKDGTRSMKKKNVPAKDETPEQQKERVRLENRERKKRWREANRLKNQNNDLRARLKKRAIHLFGVEESGKKTDWIEAEFEKRKNRRIMKSTNIEDLTMVISETMDKLDIQSINEESLSRVISQIVTSSLSHSQANMAEQERDTADDHNEDKLQELELSSLIAASNHADNHDPQLEQHGNNYEMPVETQATESPAVTEAVTSPTVVSATSSDTTHMPSPALAPTPATERKPKRSSGFLNSFNVKRVKIPLIRMGTTGLIESKPEAGSGQSQSGATPSPTTAAVRGSIKIPAFKHATDGLPLSESIPVKKEKLLMRPNFGGGLRKPAFRASR